MGNIGALAPRNSVNWVLFDNGNHKRRSSAMLF